MFQTVSSFKLKVENCDQLELVALPRSQVPLRFIGKERENKTRGAGHSELMPGDCVSPTTPRAPRPTKEQRKMTSQLVANKTDAVIAYVFLFVRQVVKYDVHGHYHCHHDSDDVEQGLPCCSFSKDEDCRLCRLGFVWSRSH